MWSALIKTQPLESELAGVAPGTAVVYERPFSLIKISLILGRRKCWRLGKKSCHSESAQCCIQTLLMMMWHILSQQDPQNAFEETVECSQDNFEISRHGNELQVMWQLLLPRSPHRVVTACHECGVYRPRGVQCWLSVLQFLFGLFDDTLLSKCGVLTLPIIHEKLSPWSAISEVSTHWFSTIQVCRAKGTYWGWIITQGV